MKNDATTTTSTKCYVCDLPFDDDAPFAGGDMRRNLFTKSDDAVVDCHTRCGVDAGLEIL